MKTFQTDTSNSRSGEKHADANVPILATHESNISGDPNHIILTVQKWHFTKLLIK